MNTCPTKASIKSFSVSDPIIFAFKFNSQLV